MNPHPIGTFARLAFARARRRNSSAVVVSLLRELREAERDTGLDREDYYEHAELDRPSVDLERQAKCTGLCSHVPEEVWSALDRAYPDVPIEGPRHRQVLAALFAPLMARQGWRFCRCYRGGLPEHRFISRLVDTGEANTAADLAHEMEARA